MMTCAQNQSSTVNAKNLPGKNEIDVFLLGFTIIEFQFIGEIYVLHSSTKNVFAMTQNTQNAIHTKTTLKPQMQNTFFILFDLDFAVQCFQFFRINSPGEAFNRTV